MDGSRFGSFSEDEVAAAWLVEPGGDRKMRLTTQLSFAEAARPHRAWMAPVGTIVDGASIPRALWSLVGSPYTGDYRRASVVHDVACVHFPHDGPDRRAADRMFYMACRVGGCGVLQSHLLYAGVRIGSWWAGRSFDREDEVKVVTSRDDQEIQARYQVVAIQLRDMELADDPNAAVGTVTMLADPLLSF